MKIMMCAVLCNMKMKMYEGRCITDNGLCMTDEGNEDDDVGSLMKHDAWWMTVD